MATATDSRVSGSGWFRGTAHGLHSQIVRYFVTGTISFFCDLTVLAALHVGVGLGLLTAGALGYLVGATVNYLIAVRWVFAHRNMGHRKAVEYLAYVAIGLTGLALNELILWGLGHRWGLHFVPVKGVSGIVVLAWTFTIRRTLLFRHRKQLERRYPPPSTPHGRPTSRGPLPSR